MNNELRSIKKNIVRMAAYSHASHVGAALSVVDILYVLYDKIVNITPENMASLDRDKVILSKGHASAALYAVLAEKCMLPREWLDRYYVDDGRLPGHLDKDTAPGIDAAAGSLGHGPSIGLGMALAFPNRKVYVIVGDGECNEGSVWEAVMFAGQWGGRLGNFTLIVDLNQLQAFGRTDEIINNRNMAARFEAFGMKVSEVDGHDHAALEKALGEPCDTARVIVAHTIKGHGVSYMENTLKWHYRSPDENELQQAYKELDNA